MRIVFTPRENGPERLVTEAELHFEDEQPLLSGLKLVGFSLWKRADGEVFVTFPSRAFGAGSDRRYFDYVRSQNGTAEAVRRLKQAIVDEFKKQTD